jgi:hypothetical protein
MTQPSHAKAATKKRVILFLVANPRDTGCLALDREAREIYFELKRSAHRDRFELVTRWAAKPLDLLRELKPVVHFSGHGDESFVGTAEVASNRDVAAPGAPCGCAGRPVLSQRNRRVAGGDPSWEPGSSPPPAASVRTWNREALPFSQSADSWALIRPSKCDAR